MVWSASSNGQIVGWDPVTLTTKKEVRMLGWALYTGLNNNMVCVHVRVLSLNLKSGVLVTSCPIFMPPSLGLAFKSDGICKW